MSDADRPVWGTRKHRAEDLVEGDVIRNGFGKWDVITSLHFDDDDSRYVGIDTECGGSRMYLRTVHLVDVQVAKPS